jgi:hypothetical protein
MDLRTWKFNQWVVYLRRLGMDVLVVPSSSKSRLMGRAYVRGDGTPRIDIYLPPAHPLALYTLFHEVAHHTLGHCDRWTSQPAWQHEYAADELALRYMRRCGREDLEAATVAAKDNVRRYLQPYFDAELWYHCDLEVAEWAGVWVSPAAAKAMERQDSPDYDGPF